MYIEMFGCKQGLWTYCYIYSLVGSNLILLLYWQEQTTRNHMWGRQIVPMKVNSSSTTKVRV